MPKVVPGFLGNAVEKFGIPGIAAIVILPVAIPVVAVVGKSLSKAAIKGGVVLYKKSRGAIAVVGENFADIVAEAKAELAEAEFKRLEGK